MLCIITEPGEMHGTAEEMPQRGHPPEVSAQRYQEAYEGGE